MSAPEHDYSVEGRWLSRFVDAGEQSFRPASLCGTACDCPPGAASPLEYFHVRTDESPPGGPASAQWISAEFEADAVRLKWNLPQQRLVIESTWSFCGRTGTWRRSDVLRNPSDRPVRLLRYSARFTLAAGRYRAACQGSQWCRENQTAFRELDGGELRLTGRGGRSSQDATPWLACLPKDGGSGLAMHVYPMGDWQIRAKATWRGFAEHLPTIRLETGLDDEDLALTIEAGESWTAPQVLLGPVPRGRLELSAPLLHERLLREDAQAARPEIPLVYNTWFDVFEQLEPQRLRRQLDAAKRAGCEVFVVDAGWYGAGEGNWAAQTGDWREKPHAAFRGKMGEFADEVRAAGLGFGLWMEPERYCTGVPVLAEHPDFFLLSASGAYYPDLENPAAYRWLLDEISRLVEDYALAWMKVDFNHRIGPDPRGGALSAYHALWYELVDTLRGRHPQCVFEGCASGGMRLDLESTRHFETHFLSDNVEPIESLRIFEGAVLRSLPGRIGRWSCLRACEGIPTYARKAEDAAPRVAHAGGATWEPFVETSPVFAARMAMCGAWGLSGDLASLADRQIDQLAGCAAFYKRWRRFIAGSAFTPLTAAMPIHRRDGFSAFLLRPPGGEASLVFAYGLERDVPPRVQLPLTGLDAGREYTVEDPDEADAEPLRLPGRRLAEDGLEIALAPRTARIRILRPV